MFSETLKKLEKNWKFYQKTSKSRKVKSFKNKSIEPRNLAVNFCHNVEYVFSHLRMDEYQKLTKILGNLKKIADGPGTQITSIMTINVKKYEKNCKFCQKMLKFVMAKS